jgi:hypothetical protein
MVELEMQMGEVQAAAALVQSELQHHLALAELEKGIARFDEAMDILREGQFKAMPVTMLLYSIP